MQPILTVTEAGASRRQGLQDGGHIIIRCSNCDAKLMDVWRTRPYEPEAWKVKAVNCPWCDESPKTKMLGGSYVVEVKGGFHPGGYGEPVPGTEDTYVESTVAIPTAPVDGVFLFTIKKAPNGKPCK